MAESHSPEIITVHYTLHLTAGCNMQCDYCYVKKNSGVMALETARRVIDNAMEAKQKKTGIAFFGGEPLLHKGLLKNIILYARNVSEGTDAKFYFKLTTNGTLLDEEFIGFCRDENLFIAISLDGIPEAHNAHRIGINGAGTYEKTASAARLLLKSMPNSPVMITVNPDTVKWYAKSVNHLYNMGFVYILCGINYTAEWKVRDINELKKQYKKLAKFYFSNTMAENKFYLSPFEMKIKSHVNNRTYCGEKCEFGKNQISVAPDGSYYPCIEFIGDEKFRIGDVWKGINENLRQKLLITNEMEKQSCENCSIRRRCNHYCACQNKRATGTFFEVSVVLCRHEQILVSIADKLAERLHKKHSEMFIQKHYNEYYPVLSIIEDMAEKGS